MSLPNDVLSTIPKEGSFVGSRALDAPTLIDYEDGGIDLQNATNGLRFQAWKASVENDSIYLEAPTVPKLLVYLGEDITELSFTFDQNMNYCLCFVEGGVAKLRWYDSSIQAMTTTVLPYGVKTPKVTLDDKRVYQSPISDIVLAYIRDGMLRVCYQRERFSIEHDITLNVPEPQRTEYRREIAEAEGLVKIGMNSQSRLQFMLHAAKKVNRPGVEEPPINYTLSLNHFNTATGNTSADVYTAPWTLENGAKLLPTGGRFGGCVEVDGKLGAYIRSPTGVPLNIGIMDRQYEFFVKCSTYTSSNKPFFTLYTGPKGWSSIRLSASTFGIIGSFINEDQVGWKRTVQLKTGSGTLDAWTHIAITITGGISHNVIIYIDGVPIHIEADWIMPAGESGTLHLGYHAGVSDAVYLFDEFKSSSKITYTAAFTPPALPFTA